MSEAKKAWVIIKTPISAVDYSYVTGDLAELDEDEANRLVNAGYAAAITKTDAQDLKRISAKFGMKVRVG